MKRKLILSYILIILFISSIAGFVSVHMYSGFYRNEYKNHLLKESHMLSDIMVSNENIIDENYYDDFVESYGKELNFRITLINSSGKVLADSDADEIQMENHSNRIEVEKALKGEENVEIRYSDSIGIEYIYSATPVVINGETIVLRISVPLTALHNMQKQIMVYIMAGIIAAAGMAFIYAYFLSDKISKPIDELTKAAKEISEGKYSKRIVIKNSNDQIGGLTDSFNYMSERLTDTINALENENVKLESILNSLMNGVVAIDCNNNILMINTVFRKFFNLPEDVIGCNFYDIVRDEALYGIVEEVQKKNHYVSNEITFKAAMEETKILRIYAAPILGNHFENEKIGSVIVFQNVTQIRKLEQMRSDFVSNVTHELKTPLTSIMGFTDTLKAGAIDDKKTALKFIDIIEIESKRLFRLIQDILSLSEIETRKEDINLEYANLEEIVDSVCEVLEPQAKAKNIQLIKEFADNIPKFKCNRDRISQMFINLIENGIKYTEEGSVKISCRKNRRYIEINVLDTGIGIPEESKERIFERFYRVDKGRSRKAGGTGLGLSIVKHIVFLYDGKLWVESKIGKGSKFVILLPYES